MIYNNINDILTLNKKETKFRHYHYNWVYMRRFVSGIRELQATLTDRKCDHQTTEKKASRTF